MTKRICFGGMSSFYKYPVIYEEDGAEIRPLIRLVPVRGREKEAVALMDKLTGFTLSKDEEARCV